MKIASLLNKRNPTNAKTQKLKKANRELTNTYQKEQKEYIQSQINKIRNSVEHTIYPTPPLGQDMTQGQFLSGV